MTVNSVFSSAGGSGAAAGRRNRDRGSGRDAPLLFEHLGELSRLEDGEAGEVVDDFLQVSHLIHVLLGSNQSRLCEGPYAASLLEA